MSDVGEAILAQKRVPEKGTASQDILPGRSDAQTKNEEGSARGRGKRGWIRFWSERTKLLIGWKAHRKGVC